MRKPPKLISILVLISFLTYPIHVYAEDILPQGGVVTAGSATMDYSQAGTLNVNVAANQNIANWQSYSVGANNTVNYNRDSAFTFLNRVVGSDASSIFGSINAVNGKIFLINQSGILFAPGSSVNAGGFAASTLDIRDADFLAGRFTFFGKGGSIVNQGYISTPGGYVALLGSTVENAGVIEANLGTVILASGEKITLGLDPQDIISVVIDEATTQNLESKDAAVHNIGKITADGGKVILTAKTLDGIFKNAINNDGIIEANTLDDKAGLVRIEANQRVAVNGSIGAQGGKVEVDSQGADFGGFIDSEEGDFYMNDGDTFISGTYAGNMTWNDNLNIYVNGNLKPKTFLGVPIGGNLTFNADKDNNGTGEFGQYAGTTITGQKNITINAAERITLGDINFYGDNFNATARTG